MNALIKSIVLCLTYTLAYHICQSQNNLPLDHVPQITYHEMMEEYDLLVSYIQQLSPVIYYNKEVRKIDFDQHVKKLRAGITPKTTLPEYLNTVYRTINAAQDNHTSVLSESYLKNYIQRYWIPSGVKVIGYDSLSVNYARHYDSYFNNTFRLKLNLELIYTDGAYYNLLAFDYKNQHFPSEMKLRQCNGKNVHDVVGNMVELMSALKWDRNHRVVYHEQFYKSPFIFEKDSLTLLFSDKSGREHVLKIAKSDTVAFAETKKHRLGYNADAKTTAHYFDNEHIFYARLPLMQEELGDSICKKLKSITDNHTVNAIVLDIRGNGGGSDNTFTNILKKIIKKPLTADVMIGRNFSPINCDYEGITNDTIQKYPHLSLEAGRTPTLQSTKLFYIKFPAYTYVTPDSPQYRFNGNVYILQDRFIYSSASNLSNLAYHSDQLISIGENPNLLGGLQTNPIAICLPHSKLFLRIEPQIDFTNIKTKADIFQNNVEHPVNYPISFLHQRATTDEDITGKQFLHDQDPMFRKVLNLEAERKKSHIKK